MSEKYLKVGKISEKMLRKWVFAPVTNCPQVIQGPMAGEDCAALEFASEEIAVLTTDPITATEENIGYLAIHITLNDLAAAGAEPIGVLVTILLPASYPQRKLEAIFQELNQTVERENVVILGGHTEVTDAVNRAIISVTGVGKVNANQSLFHKKIEIGDSIVMTKYAGVEGTSILAKEKEEELKSLYAEEFLERAKSLGDLISVQKESRIAMQTPKANLKAMHDVTEGGVLGAVWELAEKAKLGVEIDMASIPILQETIEISEFFDINPYKLISSGAMLMVAGDGEVLIERLMQEGINAVIIGKITQDKDKVVVYSGVRQSIPAPAGDELYKVL